MHEDARTSRDLADGIGDDATYRVRPIRNGRGVPTTDPSVLKLDTAAYVRRTRSQAGELELDTPHSEVIGSIRKEVLAPMDLRAGHGLDEYRNGWRAGHSEDPRPHCPQAVLDIEPHGETAAMPWSTDGRSERVGDCARLASDRKNENAADVVLLQERDDLRGEIDGSQGLCLPGPGGHAVEGEIEQVLD